MNYLNTTTKKPILIWLYTGLCMVFFMIAVGGLTRLTESGLSITEWNVIMGAVPPLNDQDWQSEFQKYQASPEFQLKNVNFSMQDFKFIYWWEWIHRQIGRLIGVVFLIPFVYFLSKKYFKPQTIKRLLVIFLLGGFQGFLGWYMVSSGLVNEPRVSHFRLAMHLSAALTTIALIWWLIMDIRFEGTQPSINKYPGYFKWVIGFFPLLALQIVYGAFVAGLDAGQNYNTWPKMGDEWIASAAFTLPGIFQNLINNPWGIQLVHRVLAILVFAYVVVLWIKSRKLTLRTYQKRGVQYMLLAVILQFTLGVTTILVLNNIYTSPVSTITIALLHQLGAVILILSSLYFTHRLRANV